MAASARSSHAAAVLKSLRRLDRAAMREARIASPLWLAVSASYWKQRLPGDVEMLLLLGSRRVEPERRRLRPDIARSLAGGRARPHRRGRFRSARPYASVPHSWQRSACADAFQRLDGLVERRRILPRLSDVEPPHDRERCRSEAGRPCVRARSEASAPPALRARPGWRRFLRNQPTIGACANPIAMWRSM